MKLEPGPIEFGLTPEVEAAGPAESFEALAVEEAEWVAAYLSEDDAQLGEAFNHSDEDWIGFIDASLLPAAEGITAAMNWQDDATMEGAVEAELEVDAAIIEAYAEMPAEAWQEVPAPFVPPPDATQFTPVEDSTRGPGVEA